MKRTLAFGVSGVLRFCQEKQAQMQNREMRLELI